MVHVSQGFGETAAHMYNFVISPGDLSCGRLFGGELLFQAEGPILGW